MICLLVSSLALSGCASDDEPTSEQPTQADPGQDAGDTPSPVQPSTPETPESPAEPAGNSTPARPQNSAPVLVFTSDVQEGEVPFEVSLTINGTDVDGDVLAWSLLQDGTEVAAGSSLPAIEVVAIEAEGTYVFQAVLSDGNVSVNATVEITAVAGGVQPIEPETFSQFVLLACPQCTPAGGATPCVSFQTEDSGLDCAIFALEARHQLQPFSATSDLEDSDLEFRTDCTPDGSSLALFGTSGPEAGVVPEGAGCVILWDPSGVPIPTVEITIGGP